MKTNFPRITIYRHPHCERCAQIARFHHKLDWFHRIATSTDMPPTGPLRMGEAVVEDHCSGRVARGAEAFGLICRQVTLYTPLRLLLWFPAFRRMLDRKMSGCENGACEMPIHPWQTLPADPDRP